MFSAGTADRPALLLIASKVGDVTAIEKLTESIHRTIFRKQEDVYKI